MQAEATGRIAEKTPSVRRAEVRWTALGICLVLGLAADYLIVGPRPGFAIIVFLAATGLGVKIACPRRDLAGVWKLSLAGTLFAVALFPLLVDYSLLSLLIGVCGLCVFTLMATGSFSNSQTGNAGKVAWLIFSGPVAFPLALTRAARSLVEPRQIGPIRLAGWILPIGLGSVFLYLFSTANPIIENWLSLVDFLAWIASIDVVRVVFILAAMALSWPFLQGRLVALRWRAKTGAASKPVSRAKPKSAFVSVLLGPAAMIRSLVLFNALFAVQTALDIAYLWGGRALPDGMSFATYAHRGAYPLVATALIAAVFTLVAMRRGSETETSAPVRHLVLLWTAQNVLLVASSIFRLDLYVAVYSLTLLRVEAFVWMGLVATGLVLIMVRIYFNRNNSWLVRWNLVSLGLTLYACSLINFPAFIANYNVDHSLEVSGQGVPLDVPYLITLGPQVIPALDRYARLRFSPRTFDYDGLQDLIEPLGHQFGKYTSDWRSWSLRNARLKIYLNNGHFSEP